MHLHITHSFIIVAALSAAPFVIACSGSTSGTDSSGGDASAPARDGAAEAAAPSGSPTATGTPSDAEARDADDTSADDSATADPKANQLVFYAIPAPASTLNPNGVSWDTPGALVRGVLVNEGGSYIGFTRTIGHAGVRVECAATGTKPAGLFQGSMTNVDDTEFNSLIIDKKIGLGMLFDNVQGKIEPPAALQATIDDRIANGRMAFIRFYIRPDTCQALLDYEKAYERENVQRNYGLAARPRYREGAGCSAFSMAFLELANLIEQRFHDNWSFTVRVPLWTQPLIGSPEVLIGGSRYPQNQVPVTRISTLTRPWASAAEEGQDLFGWDPTMMWNWIDGAAAKAQTDGSEKVEVQGKVRGLVLDRRNVAPTADLMSGNYWKN